MIPILGVTSGLMAGGSAAISYLFSRNFQAGQNRSAYQLMALSSAWMAGFSLFMLPWFFRVPEKGWLSTFCILLGVVGGYGLGALLLFSLLRHASSSSVTPVLGLKILVLTLFACYRGEQFKTEQWLAIGLVVCASALLKNNREGLSWFQVLWAFGACTCYAVSDSFIRLLIANIDSHGGLNAAITGAVYSYIVAGVFALVGFSHVRKACLKDWREASGYAFFWSAHMCFFYYAMASIGIIYTIILQATRSIWAVLFGIGLTKMGYAVLEKNISFTMRLRQLLAGVLTVSAIVLYACAEV